MRMERVKEQNNEEKRTQIISVVVSLSPMIIFNCVINIIGCVSKSSNM